MSRTQSPSRWQLAILAAAVLAVLPLRAEGGQLDLASLHARIREARQAGRQAELPELYNRCGISLSILGDHVRALEYYRKAFAQSSAIFGATHSRGAEYLINLAESQRKLGLIPAAIESYRQSGDIVKKRYGTDHLLWAIQASNLARLYLQNGELDAATALLQQSLSVIQRKLKSEHELVSAVRGNLCEAWLAQKQDGLALQECSAALAAVGSVRPESPQAGVLHIALGRLQASKSLPRDTDLAREHFKTGLAILGQHPVELIKAHLDIARTYGWGHDQDQVEAHLILARNLILQHRFRIGREKTFFTHSLAPVFSELIALQLRQKQIEAAFQTSTQSRGLSLVENMALQSALTSVVPESRRQDFKKLENEIYLLTGKRDADGLSQSARIWQLDLRREKMYEQLVREYPDFARRVLPVTPRLQSLIAVLRPGETIVHFLLGPEPGAFVLTRSGLRWVSLPLPANGAPALEAMMRNFHLLFTAPAGDVSRLCPCLRVRTATGAELFIDLAQPEPPFFREGALIYRDAGGKKELLGQVVAEFDDPEIPALRSNLARDLYRSLLAPALALAPGTQSLIVVPDGAAYYVPFSLLEDEQGMVLQRFPIRFIHSVAVWYALRPAEPSRATLPFLGVGSALYSPPPGAPPPSGEISDPLSSLHLENLPESELEVKAIASLAYPSAGEQHLLLGSDANREYFLQLSAAGKLRRYRFVHLALHGFLAADRPDRNALVFTRPSVLKNSYPEEYLKYRERGRPDLGLDANLYYGEARGLALDADLTVLSACNTAPGLEMGGEGMVALPQALLLSGSRAVLASFWALPSAAGQELMFELYRNLLVRKLRPEIALQQARLSMKKKYPDPYYWAGPALYRQ